MEMKEKVRWFQLCGMSKDLNSEMLAVMSLLINSDYTNNSESVAYGLFYCLSGTF